MFVVSKDYNWVHGMIQDLIKRHKPIVLGNTKKAENEANAQARGQLEGFTIALTAYATSVRLMRLPDLPSDNYHPAVEYHEVQKLLKLMLADWDGEIWKDQSDEKFFEWFDSELDKIIDAVAPDYELRRRAEVRTGNMEPQAGDEQWLAEEANMMVELANPLMDLAAKAAAKAKAASNG